MTVTYLTDNTAFYFWEHDGAASGWNVAYYEPKYTPKQWSEKVGSKNLEQYFYIIDSSSNKYGSKDNQTDNTPKVLNSTDDKSTLEIIGSTDNTKTLTYINNQTTSVATFWLDTRNNEYKLWYTTSTVLGIGS